MNSEKDLNKPGEKKITNADEQEIAVNRSTQPERGYDKPENQQKPPSSMNKEKEDTEGSRTKKSGDRDESSNKR